jgi:hypothetical protein
MNRVTWFILAVIAVGGVLMFLATNLGDAP